MITWHDISLFRFQYIDQTNAMTGIDEIEKVLLITCEIFGLSADQLNSMPIKKVNRRLKGVMKLMSSSPGGKAKKRIGPYIINYEPAEMTLGQFIELRFFLQDHVNRGHYALASISRQRGKHYETAGHPVRADYFLRQSVVDVMASLKAFIERFDSFIKHHESFFGLDKEMYAGKTETDRFNKIYGWQYSATEVAEHERITLDQAYSLPIIQALNDLTYIKAKAKYEAEQQREALKNIKSR